MMDGVIVDQPTGGYLQRAFNAGRSSLSALDSRREADLRQQVKAAVFGERPVATATPSSNIPAQGPAKLVKNRRHESNKLRAKKRVSLPATTPAPPKVKQYITATYPPRASQEYDTYTPLQLDAVAFKPLTADTPFESSTQANKPFSVVESVQVGSKPTSHSGSSAPVQVEPATPNQPSKMYSLGPTVTVKPVYTAPFKAANGLYSIDEQAQGRVPEDGYTEETKPITSYPMYSGLQSSPHHVISQTPRRVLNQPRKLSGNANSTLTTTTPVDNLTYPVREPVREPRRPDIRISTWVQHMNDLSAVGSPGSPCSPRSPRIYQRPELLKRTVPTPDERFQAIPGEILQLIIARLKDLHLSPGSDSCATCWMRDLNNLSLATRKWAKHARIALYEDIQLVGADSAIHKKKFKLSQGGRLLLLRRSLRSNRKLAGLVRSLKVPALESPPKGTPMAKAIEQYDDIISTLIMACPNLERVTGGPLTRYDHTFKRIFHALSTRTQLRQMDWLIEASPAQERQQRAQPKSPTKLNRLMMPEDLQLFEENAWLDLHANWTELSSLSIHCLPGATLTPTTLLPETLTHLPSLQHLHLCNLPANSFNDTNLLALPRLQTLTLSHISGITSNGLSTFATRATSSSLETLNLRHTALTSLAALARIFSNLGSLKAFSLIQAFSPLMPEDDLFSLWMMPYLASTSLKKLHWDITTVCRNGNSADIILAKSIAAGGFPSLRSIRVPNDPEGIFQNLCRPVERVDLPSDRFRVSDSNASDSSTPPLSPLGIGFLPTSSTSTSLAASASSSSLSTVSDNLAACSNLRTARLAAQARLEEARWTPRFRVNVTEGSQLVDVFDMAGYIGTVGSLIRYDLLPDPGSTDEKGGLVDVRDLGSESGESLLSSNGRGSEVAREGCCGFWNRIDGVVADKKERERWWHTERGRWQRIEL